MTGIDRVFTEVDDDTLWVAFRAGAGGVIAVELKTAFEGVIDLEFHLYEFNALNEGSCEDTCSDPMTIVSAG